MLVNRLREVACYFIFRIISSSVAELARCTRKQNTVRESSELFPPNPMRKVSNTSMISFSLFFPIRSPDYNLSVSTIVSPFIKNVYNYRKRFCILIIISIIDLSINRYPNIIGSYCIYTGTGR